MLEGEDGVVDMPPLPNAEGFSNSRCGILTDGEKVDFNGDEEEEDPFVWIVGFWLNKGLAWLVAMDNEVWAELEYSEEAVESMPLLLLPAPFALLPFLNGLKKAERMEERDEVDPTEDGDIGVAGGRLYALLFMILLLLVLCCWFAYEDKLEEEFFFVKPGKLGCCIFGKLGFLPTALMLGGCIPDISSFKFVVEEDWFDFKKEPL